MFNAGFQSRMAVRQQLTRQCLGVLTAEGVGDVGHTGLQQAFRGRPNSTQAWSFT
jgi:hypothetical protein